MRYEGVKCGRDGSVDNHMEMGKKLLAAGQLADALSHFHAAVDGDPKNYLAYYRRATVFLAMGKSKSALPDLSRVIELKPDFTSARLQRGNLLLKQGRLDEAESDFKKVDYETAAKHSENDRQIKEGLERAQRLLKQSQKRDYYKILGVKRTAQKKEIIRAYRKLAQQWHPDNFQDPEEKKKAEKKFIDIAQAKEVLTDPEMRTKFDHGEDPMDPESQQGHHHHHFHGGFHGFQGFNPFGSGPFNFKFNFN
ncbi:dnaJ homolog subfamily C member 3a isoform X2 [Lates japonicus]|uniref:DnaJ homolog subfamily C member 3 n=1 Tax=Lates japonicus TaxID=270547 RepID=A0AAD3N5A3_LATJO|nr:dnaJ homolog subfamily C member 3a isoform X2 [Lates japonicus]